MLDTRKHPCYKHCRKRGRSDEEALAFTHSMHSEIQTFGEACERDGIPVAQMERIIFSGKPFGELFQEAQELVAQYNSDTREKLEARKHGTKRKPVVKRKPFSALLTEADEFHARALGIRLD